MVWKELEVEVPQAVIVEEILISCIQTMLFCLCRENRPAYISGETFDVTSERWALVMNISLRLLESGFLGRGQVSMISWAETTT